MTIQGDLKAVVIDRDGLEVLARELWRELPRGAVVWLTGELGSGKTTLVQAVARAAGAAPALSPTFALVHEYPSPDGPLIHVDCFRLRDPAEARDLDFRGLLRTARLLLVEWPEKGGALVPPPDAHLRLAHTGAPERRRVERLR